MFHQKFEKRNLNRIPYRSYVTFNFSDLEIEFFPRLILWFVEKSILLFFLFFFFFVCFKLRSKVWIERYFVTFRWSIIVRIVVTMIMTPICRRASLVKFIRTSGRAQSFSSLHPRGWSGWSFTIIVSFSRSSYLNRSRGFVLFSKSSRKENRHPRW